MRRGGAGGNVRRWAARRRADNPRARDRGRAPAPPDRRRRGPWPRARRADRPAVHLPSPTSFSEPTIERTWLCRNERAEASMTISSPAALTSSTIERLDGRLGLAAGGAEGGEVVPADQHGRRLRHRLGAHRLRHPPHPVAVEHRRRRPRQDAVAVVPRQRAEARVEIVGDLRAFDDGDRIGLEVEVERRRAPCRSASCGSDRSARPGPAHARRRRCGRRRAPSRSRRTACGWPRPRRPCTELPAAWICQPTNGVPSYSMMTR